jgi:hypothetical protein
MIGQSSIQVFGWRDGQPPDQMFGSPQALLKSVWDAEFVGVRASPQAKRYKEKSGIVNANPIAPTNLNTNLTSSSKSISGRNRINLR